MLVTAKEMLDQAAQQDCAIAAFNVFGYEDAVSVVRAAEELNAPVILATNKVAISHMPIEYLGNLLCSIAEDARVPVVVHLDHGKDYETVAKAVLSGYTSVMYDGSQLALEENIQTTQEIAKLAHASGVPLEAEVGAVGYSDPSMNVKAIYTEPEEAKIFAEKTKVDSLAVAVGTLHRMQTQTAEIQYDRLESIEDLIETPIVIHGSTGLPDQDLDKLASRQVAKVNVGTALRMTFGNSLRKEINANPEEFDRIALFEKPMIKIQEEAKKKMTILKSANYFTGESKSVKV
jgi:fructose-bisphosphate aldolase class II